VIGEKQTKYKFHRNNDFLSLRAVLAGVEAKNDQNSNGIYGGLLLR
jgi:hypothetical protein